MGRGVVDTDVYFPCVVQPVSGPAINRKPVMIFRVCVECRAEFGVMALSSRALYCPACRKRHKMIVGSFKAHDPRIR